MLWFSCGRDTYVFRSVRKQMSVPAHAVHTASIPLTELLLGFSSWNPDTSGSARNSKLSVPFHASGTAFLMMFAVPLQSALIIRPFYVPKDGITLAADIRNINR